MNLKNSCTEEYYSNILDDNIKGFLSEEQISNIPVACSITITREFVYRPDKIAEYYLGNSYCDWAITLVNRFSKGISEYYLGRTISIPDISNLGSEL